VVGVDVGNDPDGRQELQERSVGFIGLENDILSLADPGVRPEIQHLAADDRGGIDPGVREQVCQKR
jgi:hypothetical protein